MTRTRQQSRKTGATLDRRFRTALANAGLTMTDWAGANGWTRSHVIQVVKGRHESSRVIEAVRDFVHREEKAIAARVGAA